ncbi:MAG: hypothetical protein K2M96_06735 [Prevotella sp.]|nr:hypothetical protein [Prevotella sp.]
MCRHASHHVPMRSASCADTLRTMRRHAPHHVPIRSAPCADVLRIMQGLTVVKWPTKPAKQAPMSRKA